MAIQGFSQKNAEILSEDLSKAFASIGFPDAPPNADLVPAIEKPKKKKHDPQPKKNKALKPNMPVYHSLAVELAKNSHSLASLGMLYVLESLIGPDGAYINYTILQNSIGIARQNIKPRIDHLIALGIITVEEKSNARRGKFIKLNDRRSSQDKPPVVPQSMLRGGSYEEMQRQQFAELFFWCFLIVKKDPEAMTTALVNLLIDFALKNDKLSAAGMILQYIPYVQKNAYVYFQKIIDTGGGVDPAMRTKAEEINTAGNNFFLIIGTEILPKEWEKAAQILRITYGLNPAAEIQRTYKERIEKFTRKVVSQKAIGS